MNCTKTKASLQDLQINWYRVWMKPKALPRKGEKRNHMLLGQYLLSARK